MTMLKKNSAGQLSRLEPVDLVDERPAYGRQQAPLLEVLWRRRWVVLSALFSFICFAALYLILATPIYTSSARIFVNQAGPKLLTSDSDAGFAKSDSYLYTQAQILSSNPILTDALSKLDVAKMKTFNTGSASADNPLLQLNRLVRVDVGKKDDLITISVDSEAPKEAAEVVNRVVESYMAFSNSVKRNSAGEVLKVLARQRDATDHELSLKMKEMVKFKQENGALSFQTKDSNIIIERLAALQQSLTQCELDAAQAQAEYEIGKGMLSDPVAMRLYVVAQQSKGPQSVDPEYQNMRADLHKYELEMSAARLTQSDNNKAIRGVSAMIGRLNSLLLQRERHFAEAHLAELDQRLQAARTKEAAIRQTFETQQKAALDLNAKATVYDQLQAEYDRLQETSKLLNSRIKDTNVTEDAGALNIQVLEDARPGEKPTAPKKSATLGAGLLLGLIVGVGVALSLEWMDRKLRTADEVESALGLPILGVVPHMKNRHGSTSHGKNVHTESGSAVAEAYRTIRTAVQFGTRSAEAVKTLLITSPSPGDGKSTSASNLAIAFAQAGYRTLLIDADLRKPTQHKIFNVNSDVGLTSAVAGQAKLAACIHKTEIPKLSLLPCGPIPSNPAELLNGQRFNQIMRAVTGVFDKIVIDSPPVVPVTDARILAVSVDVTLLVVRARKTTDRLGRFAIESLQSVGTVLLGVVVNDISKGRDGTATIMAMIRAIFVRLSQSAICIAMTQFLSLP